MKLSKIFSFFVLFATLCGCATGETILAEQVSITPDNPTVMVGSQITITGTVSPSNATNKNCVYALGVEDKYGSIDFLTGVFSATAEGSVKVFAYSQDSYQKVENPVMAWTMITITPFVEPDVPVTSITVSPSSASVDKYSTTTLVASVKPTNASNLGVTWSSADTTIATVNAGGVVTGVKEGSTTIRATAKDGTNIFGEASLTVNYKDPIKVASISISPSSPTVSVGGYSQLTATVLPSNAVDKTLLWSSDNTGVCTVDSTGRLNGISEGSANIRATAQDGSNVYGQIAATVKINEDPYHGNYYDSISDSLTGDSLLSALRSLNSSKRKSTVGYGSMGTTISNSKFVYTDYDPSTVEIVNGVKKGTKILSFYSGTPTTSWNREHTWPNSHGGNLIEDDIHMTRPTIASENGSRGNSFYVEGMKDQSKGWDPAMESFGVESYRGDAARIIFYGAIASSSLSLVDVNYHSTTNNNRDNLMGKLSDLLKWNLEYPVLEREDNRNEGAEYLQGNRNPFIDKPSYACKLWGNYNQTTKQICGM